MRRDLGLHTAAFKNALLAGHGSAPRHRPGLPCLPCRAFRHRPNRQETCGLL